MALRLYKTLFWISFSIMICGSVGYLFEIYTHTQKPTIDNVILHKVKTNSPFYSRSVLNTPTENDFAEAKEDMNSSIVELLGYYEYKNTAIIFAFIMQFFILIILRKWSMWVFYGQKAQV